MSIGIFLNHATPTTGPGKVATNLFKGFEKLGVDFAINNFGGLNGCLQPSPFLKVLPPRSLIGPNLMVLPTEMPFVWERYKNYIVPSQWTNEWYASYDITGKCNIDVWPIGIDTDLFDVEKKDTKRDCFIYFKNRTQEELKSLKNYLTIKKISFEVIEYGHYTEEKLLNAVKESRFCILLTKTESQGIAYMEILSTNTPCYVFNKAVWDDYGAEHACSSSSVPFFDDSCGVIAEKYEEFDYFLDNLNSFEPRSYILSNHTLIQSAQKYLKLLEKSHLEENENESF